ncbi:MAG: ribokinase [Pseudomonadota bacterium]
MTVFNFGSINLDLVYQLPHLPQPGETLASTGLERGLGGKGANQSVAIAKAGGRVVHIGAVGEDGTWLKDQMASAGVGVDHIAVLDEPTGHAVIYVDDGAENVIVLYEGANRALTMQMAQAALDGSKHGDWLLAQNETNLVPEVAALAKSRGLKIAFAAAPFDPAAVEAVLDHVDLIAVNAIEAAQLAESLPHQAQRLSQVEMLVTLGSKGAELRRGDDLQRVSAFPVQPVDTTGAGDTFLGFYLAATADGDTTAQALQTASAAAAIQVTRPGASSAIPSIAEVQTLLDQSGDAS